MNNDIDFEKRTEAGLVLRSINNFLIRATMQQAKKLEIDNCTMMHGWILGYLCNNKDKNVYQRDIEREFSITRSAVTSIVKAMENSGYINRADVEHDARLKQIVITQKGEEMHKRIVQSLKDIDSRAVNGISESDYQVFLKVCYQIKDNLRSLL